VTDAPSPEEARPSTAGLRARISVLEYEVARLQGILRQARDILVTTDMDGRLTSFNEEAETVLGYTASEIIGQPAEVLYVHSRTRRKLLDKLRDSTQGVVRAEVQVRTKQGQKRWFGISLSWLEGPNGNRIGTIGVSKEISAKRKLEEKLRRLSITDKLTGLYNQSHFFQRLEIEKERALRLGHSLSLLLFDLDGFKKLNDAQGHVLGDALLRGIGGVLFKNVRKEVDSAFRYGGDEFTVLLPGADADTAVKFADRVREQIVALRVEGQTLAVGASMGVTCFDKEDRSQQIIAQADTAMYLAKRAGGQWVAVHRPESGEAELVGDGAPK
jgi:diguanylate cyclase (GGDEF)-like protein/PAS domain S-box-containing protein